MSAAVDQDESLGLLLLKLILHLAHLLVPIVLVALLPLPWALALLPLLALLQILCVRLGFRRAADELGFLLVAALLGAAFPLAAWVPGWWGVPVAALAVLLGLGGIAQLGRRLGLTKIEPEKSKPQGRRGASAWGGGEPALTPEAEPVRLLNRGEIAMGGPSYCDYLFPDGVLLQGLGSSALFSGDGRYFVAPVPSRERWGLAVLERPTRTLYRFEQIDCFWELDAFDEQLCGRRSPLDDDQAYRLDLRALLAQSSGVALQPLGDLWLEPQACAQLPLAREYPAPAGRSLRGEPWLPASLRTLQEPLAPLRRPALCLWLDGEDSGLRLAVDEAPVWDSSGRLLACRARQQDEDQAGYWCWRPDEGWRALPPPWCGTSAEPAVLLGAVEALEEEALLIGIELALSELDQLGQGHELRQVYSAIEVVDGHDDRGRARVQRRELQPLQLVLPLRSGAAGRGLCRLRLRTEHAERLELSWLRDSADGRLGAYACERNGERLPGEWQLDLRSSADGRYLGLLGFCEAPAAPGTIALLDVARGRLHCQALEMPLVRLLDLRGERLWVAALAGRLDEGREATPLRRFDRQAPHPVRAAAFLAEGVGSRPCYRERQLRLDAEALQLLPEWRLAERPQAANAEGDFVLPAPRGGDAAWVFGACTEYRDNYPRERHPRSGACLLTASGLGLADLTPALIWSADARYLLVTRQEEADHWHEFGRPPAQWRPYLLDLQAHRLHGPGPDLGCMPLLESFAAGLLRYQRFDTDWQTDEEAGTPEALVLETMLDWPAQDLVRCGSLWLEARERERAGQWAALDDQHLNDWRKS